MTVENLAEREEAVRLYQAMQVAKTAWWDHPLDLVIDDVGAPTRCAKSGVPVLSDDEVVTDEQTGEMWLRSALGLPPRPETVSEETDEGDEAELEIEAV